MLLGCLQLFLCRMWWGLVGEVCPHQSSHRECCAFLGWYKWCANPETSLSWLSLLETHWCALGGGQCRTLWSRCLRSFCQHREKLLFGQQSTRCSSSFLYDDSSSLMRPTAAMSSSNLMMWFVLCLAVHLWVIMVNNSPAQYDGAGPVFAYPECLRSASKEIQI